MGILDRFNQQPKTPPAALVPAPGQHIVTFEGLGMHWVGCRASVEAELQAVPGAHDVAVDLQHQTATVIFDPTETDAFAFREAISQAGFPPADQVERAG